MPDKYSSGDLMRQVAQKLTDRGFGIRYPEREEDRRLGMTDPTGICSVITVADSGNVLWECAPWAPGEADPKKMADAITSLLTGRMGGYRYRGDAYGRDGMTLKGIVGRELAARGLDVTLEIYKDTDIYDVDAAITVTNPGTEEDARAWADDSGCITWECDYWPEVAAFAGEPDLAWRVTDPGKLVDTIVENVTLAARNVAAIPGAVPG